MSTWLGRGDYTTGQNPQGQDEGSGVLAVIQNIASSSRRVYTPRFSCLDHTTDFPLEAENYKGLNTFQTISGLQGPVWPGKCHTNQLRGPGDWKAAWQAVTRSDLQGAEFQQRACAPF